MLRPALVLSTLALSALALLVQAEAAEGYRRYVNERFGASADIPAGWRAGRAPDNGDGLRFTSPDGRAFVSVSGALHASDTIGEEIDAIASEPGASITLEKRGSRSLVQSGLRSGTIFYKKSLLACNDQVWTHLVIEYPAAQKAGFDALVTHVAASLAGGTGYQVDCK